MPGDYTYTCGETANDTQDLTVVSAEYVFSICEDCDFMRSNFSVMTGDSVRWVLLPERGQTEAFCSSMELQDEAGMLLEAFPMGEDV